MTNRVAWLCSTVSPTRRTTKAKGDLDPSTPCHYAVYGGRNRLLTQATSVPQSTENIPLFPWQPYYVYYSHQHKPVCRSVQPTVLSHGYSFRSNLLYAICLNNSFFFFFCCFQNLKTAISSRSSDLFLSPSVKKPTRCIKKKPLDPVSAHLI